MTTNSRSRRKMGIVAVAATMAVLIVGAVAGWAGSAAAQSFVSPPQPASSQRLTPAQAGACTQSCQAEFAQCYKDTGSNRRVCEARLQQCLATCINKR